MLRKDLTLNKMGNCFKTNNHWLWSKLLYQACRQSATSAWEGL